MKPMSSKLRHIPLFSGNTILGDGAVVLIIDPNGIARVGRLGGRARAVRRPTSADRGSRRRRRRGGDAAGLPRRRREPEGGAAVARDAARGDRRRQDRVGRRPAAGPIPRPAHAARSGRPGRSPSGARARKPSLVFSDGERSMGLVVDEIVDIVDDRLDIELAADRSGHRRLGGDPRPRDRDRERRPLSAARLSTTGRAPPRSAARPTRRPSCSSTTPPSSASMLTPVLKAAGYRVAAAESAERAMALIAVRGSRRRRRDRHRHAGHERLRSRRGAAPGPARGSPAGDRAVIGADAAGGRARRAGSASPSSWRSSTAAAWSRRLPKRAASLGEAA